MNYKPKSNKNIVLFQFTVNKIKKQDLRQVFNVLELNRLIQKLDC